jgi:hypothetical protein
MKDGSVLPDQSGCVYGFGPAFDNLAELAAKGSEWLKHIPALADYLAATNGR